MSRLCLCCLPLLLAASALVAGPGDWPCWRGPDRTGLSPETGLLREWPAGGPKLLWTAKGLGGGYSTPSLEGGRIYLLGTATPIKGRRGSGVKEVLLALDARDGQRLWATPVGETTASYPGPRSTPTVDGDLLYAISSDGKLVCADKARGQVRWRKDFKADFGGRCGNWAYAESPLIDGDVVVCTPGGEKATLVALNKKTGATVWKAAITGLAPAGRARASGSTAGYASAVVAEIGGVRQYVQYLGGGVVGVSAADGKKLWQYTGTSGGNANATTPLVRGDRVFTATSYGVGGGLARVSKDGNKFSAKEEFFVKQMQNHHGGMLLIGEHIYGTNNNSLLCVSFKDGSVAWQDRCVGKGSVAYADGMLYVRGERGAVALVEATPKAYREKGRFSQPSRSSNMAWPHPVVAGGKLYLRDWDALLCYDVKAK
jgi:outer membrane protein assembly factor BamB